MIGPSQPACSRLLMPVIRPFYWQFLFVASSTLIAWQIGRDQTKEHRQLQMTLPHLMVDHQRAASPGCQLS